MLRLEPNFASSWGSRGSVWNAKGEYDKAMADYNQALQLDPKCANAHDGLAWLRATCIDDRYRDGKQAVEFATKARELRNWKSWGSLAALAAAHAELGNFTEAVKWQQRAHELAPPKQKEKMASRLDLYKSGKPYRYEPKKD